MKKILIGTHNRGKFKEIAYLISKNYRKISPLALKIKSPKETGKTFVSNSKLKAKFFSRFVNYPVISDDSGICIRSLNNRPGIYSARLAKKHGNFFKAMKFILKKMLFNQEKDDLTEQDYVKAIGDLFSSIYNNKRFLDVDTLVDRLASDIVFVIAFFDCCREIIPNYLTINY